MGGELDVEEGILKSVVLPDPTAAHEKANEHVLLDERTDATKRILDTNNSSRPPGPVLAITSVRDMQNHDAQMCRQLLLASGPRSLWKLSRESKSSSPSSNGCL